MEIVEEKNTRDWSQKCRCEYCRKLLNVHLADLQRRNMGYEGPNAIIKVVFKCIVCKRINDIDSKVPQWARQEVFARKKKSS